MNLSRIIASKIKVAVRDDVYLEKLSSERELAKQYQVSRSTIREALKELQKEGIVVTKRGSEGGAFISELNSEPIANSFNNLITLGKVDIPHLFHARICIEPQIAKAAAKIRKKEDIKRLASLIDESRQNMAIEAIDSARLINIDFHWQISRILGNPILSFISESITYNFKLLIIAKETAKPSDIAENINEHIEILSAIEKKNIEEAEEKTLLHILNGYRKLKQTIPEIVNIDVDECIDTYKLAL